MDLNRLVGLVFFTATGDVWKGYFTPPEAKQKDGNNQSRGSEVAQSYGAIFFSISLAGLGEKEGGGMFCLF